MAASYLFTIPARCPTCRKHYMPVALGKNRVHSRSKNPDYAYGYK